MWEHLINCTILGKSILTGCFEGAEDSSILLEWKDEFLFEGLSTHKMKVIL